MKKVIFCLAIILSCTTKRAMDRNIEIDICYAQSAKVDLKRNIYTVFYVSKASSEIKFALTNEERNKIVNEYYDLKLDQIAQKMSFSDRCMIMPKTFTTIHTKALNKTQEIIIDNSCQDFYFWNSDKAKRVIKFINLIERIILSKPEIKNAPESDIFYM